MRFTPQRLLMLATLLFLLPYCRNAPRKDKTGVPMGRIFFNVAVDGRDDEDNITLKLQCQDEARDGDGVIPGEDFSVSLDGKPFRSDSSRFYGYYYELQVPLDSFTGQHVLELQTQDRSLYKDTFSFRPLALVASLPDSSLSKSGFKLQLGGIPEGERVRLVMSDTSFSSDGFNELLLPRSGILELGAADLQSLSPGPLHMELIREWERPLANTPGAGGVFRLFYTLRREFILTE